MKAAEIRKKFLEYFKSKGHEIVDSAPLVVKDDPTLMFTNAGMNQFKDIFLGNKQTTASRVADTQKCLRVSGKHNDLEEVGMDTYHHTMFEMLGNWSFGDYFKKEAIEWAWDLLVNEFKLPADRMYATVFGGDEVDGLEPDNEASSHWEAIIPKDRVLFCGKEDNFWEMGETGPCGPCSEIHIDLRTEDEIEKLPGVELVNKDHPQVVEIWNLVFIQFNRLAGGELESLPQKHVDTGMGFERLTMAIQGKLSNYDTDVFQPLIKELAEKAGVKYGENEKEDIALRVISDHVRAVSFAISDGQLPGNSGAGYVIRRILRRAVRYGYTFLDFKKPFLSDLVPTLAKQFEDVFPELNQQLDFVKKVIEEEEVAFLRTLENGLGRIDSIMEASQTKTIDGKLAFELYDTFGFPLDLTMLIARENGFDVDLQGFETEMSKQKSRSKADAEKEEGDWITVNDDIEPRFVGYDQLQSDSKILKYRTINQKGKDRVQLILDSSPFYAESGGQVGDIGTLTSETDQLKVLDTKKENNVTTHYVDRLPNNVEAIFNAKVDISRRGLIMNNHTATHLMHAALREVLGSHVEQRGSLVNEKLLRFDFSHFSKMTPDEIEKVEKIVNERIRDNIGADIQLDVPINEAKKMGAMALFGEKYGDNVRVVSFNKDFSVELCGGTHVESTGSIGFFKIVSEASIAAGVRRIEAVTAIEAEKLVADQTKLISGLQGMFSEQKNLLEAIKDLQNEKKKVEKELESLKKTQAGDIKKSLMDKIQDQNGTSSLVERIDLDSAADIKDLAFQIRNQVDNLFMVLGAVVNGKPQLTVMISDSLMSEKDLNASDIVKDLAKEIRGGGGGQAFYATAGGGDVNGLDKALEKARQIL